MKENKFFVDLKNIQILKQQRKRNYAKAMSMSEQTYINITEHIQNIIKEKYPYLKGQSMTHNHILTIMTDLIINFYNNENKVNK